MKFARLRVLPALVVAGFFTAVAGVTFGAPGGGGAGEVVEFPTTADLGEAFFGEFLAVFEITAVLLVAALVAGVYLAMPEKARREAVRKAVDMKPRVGVGEDKDKDKKEGEAD